MVVECSHLCHDLCPIVCVIALLQFSFNDPMNFVLNDSLLLNIWLLIALICTWSMLWYCVLALLALLAHRHEFSRYPSAMLCVLALVSSYMAGVHAPRSLTHWCAIVSASRTKYAVFLVWLVLVHEPYVHISTPSNLFLVGVYRSTSTLGLPCSSCCEDTWLRHSYRTHVKQWMYVLDCFFWILACTCRHILVAFNLM